LIYTSSSNF